MKKSALAVLAQPLGRWLLQILVGLDQLVCAVFGGWADETISSYLYRLDLQRKPAGRLLRPLVDQVFEAVLDQRGHCRLSYEAERERAQCPPELRPGTPTGLPSREPL